jgi:tetratricopeptide (TPR) repeat protein
MTRFIRLLIAATLALPAALQAQTPAVNVVNTARATAAPPASLDSAILRLQDFLNRYPTSPLRPNALLQLGELLVRQADTVFAESQRAGGVVARPDSARAATSAPATTPSSAANGAPIAPDYSAAIARYEELVNRYPTFEQIDAATYTLGTLYASTQRWVDASRMFERVTAMRNSSFRSEAFFRLGDARFEVASRLKGDSRPPLRHTSKQSHRRRRRATSTSLLCTNLAGHTTTRPIRRIRSSIRRRSMSSADWSMHTTS